LLAYDTFGDHPAVASVTAPSQGNADGEEVLKNFRRAFRMHISGHHRALIENSNFWAHPVVATTLTEHHRKVALESLSDYPTVKSRRLEEADATVRSLQPLIRAADSYIPEWVALGGFWGLLLLAAFLDLGCALLLGEGLYMRMLGVVAVNRAGQKASRFRLLARTLIAWSPGFAGAVLSLLLWLVSLPGMQTTVPGMFWALVVVMALTAFGIAWAVWQPARGLVDRLVGTWLVPR
jgi:hypothetical protein